MFKNFSITEGLKMQLRGECFNLFNTPQFGAPNKSLGLTKFEVVTSEENQLRLIQVAAKLMW